MLGEILSWILIELLWPVRASIMVSVFAGAAGYWFAGEWGAGIGMMVGLLCGAFIDYRRHRKRQKSV